MISWFMSNLNPETTDNQKINVRLVQHQLQIRSLLVNNWRKTHGYPLKRKVNKNLLFTSKPEISDY